jgi:hypothetical protein
LSTGFYTRFTVVFAEIECSTDDESMQAYKADRRGKRAKSLCRLRLSGASSLATEVTPTEPPAGCPPAWIAHPSV